MTSELRNSLWNVLDYKEWSTPAFRTDSSTGMQEFSRSLWFIHFKEPVDSRPRSRLGKGNAILAEIRGRFFAYVWWEVYDFLEFTLNYFRDTALNKAINDILSVELAGYRFLNGYITELTSEEEIGSVELALTSAEFPGVQAHLKSALALFSNRQHPDYRNSIKESICAVESIAQAITKKEKATLGDALKIIGESSNLHPALEKAFIKLYGYTSDGDGIRHAMLEKPSLGPEDARFFLVACSAFVNYLKAKIPST